MSKTRVVVFGSILTIGVVANMGIVRPPPDEATASEPAEATRDDTDASPRDSTSTDPSTNSDPAPVRPGQEPDWAVYRNEAFGYEIRYPKDGRVRDRNPDMVVVEIGGGALPFSVSVGENPQGFSPREWVEDLKAEARRRADDEGPMDYAMPVEYMFADRGPDEGPVQVGTLSGYRIRTFGFDHENELVVVSARDSLYVLMFPGANPNDPDFPSHHAVYLQILQTFRLLPEP